MCCFVLLTRTSQPFGRVEKVNLVTDPVTQRPKGTCFVVFATAEAARACLERNNREATEDFRAKVCGRTVWVCEVMAQRDVRDVSKLRKSTGQLTKGEFYCVTNIACLRLFALQK